jgi:hypothetical protein
MVEQQPSKLTMRVRFPSPALVEKVWVNHVNDCPHSSGVEHFLGKEEVTGSIPVVGSRLVVVRFGVKGLLGNVNR